MAGLYDRIAPGIPGNNVNAHLIVSGLKGYGTGIWTKPQVLAHVNASANGGPLVGDEVTDYNDMADVLDGQQNSTAKLGYVNQVEAAVIAAAAGVITDAQWRTALEI